MVTWKNYEEYMTMLVDGELSSQQEQELMAFVSQHPELRGELAAFNMTRLEAPATYVFENKEALLKHASSKRVITLPVWQRYGIAAGVAAIIFISLFRFRTEESKVATVVTPASVKTQAPVVTAKQKQSTPIVEVTASARPHIVERIARVNAKSGPADISIQKIPIAEKQAVAASMERENINRVALAGPRQINNTPQNITALNDAPALALVGEIEQQERGSFFVNLGIEESKRDGMETVAEAVTNTLTNTMNKVQSIKHDIDTRSLSLRIENKRLILSF